MTNPSTSTGTGKPTRKSKASNSPDASSRNGPAAPKQPSKQDRLADMLLRDDGATLDHMVESTGWLPHTVRAALTGLKKKGYGITSDKVDGLRTYRAVAPK